jgi:heptosyltransferase-2
MSKPDAVVVLAPNWLGDAVMALPALADLRKHFADRRFVVGARPSIGGLFTLVPGVDSIVTTDISSLRAAHASVAVLFPNSFASAWAVKRAGIPQRWGYSRDMRRMLLTRAIPRPRNAMHQSEYYQHLVCALGVDNGPRDVTLTIPPNAVDEGRKILADNGWTPDSALAVLAPGAAYGKAKQWIPTHVVRLITDLVRDRGMICALVGSRGDASSIGAMRSAAPADCQPRILDLAGGTTLPVLSAIMSMARVCVSNDSGAMHLAAAAGVPTVAVFGPTNEQATSPVARADVPIEVVTNPVWCRPCMLRECPIDHRCMTGIEPGRVLAAIDRIARAIA